MRICAMTWPFPFGVRLGWATAGAPNPDPCRALGRVYLLRGQGMAFSPGFGRMCARLRRAGLWAEDVRCVGDAWVRRHLRSDQAAGRLHGPVILVGHSCGARYALYTAQQLAPLGITVDLIVCVDVAWAYDVPDNVTHAVHFYRSRWRLHPARPLLPAPGSTARIINVDLDAPGSRIAPVGLHHLNITGCPALQDWIVRYVLENTATKCRPTR